MAHGETIGGRAGDMLTPKLLLSPTRLGGTIDGLQVLLRAGPHTRIKNWAPDGRMRRVERVQHRLDRGS